MINCWPWFKFKSLPFFVSAEESSFELSSNMSIPHLPVPYIFGSPGVESSYLIYWLAWEQKVPNIYIGNERKMREWFLSQRVHGAGIFTYMNG